MWLEGHFTNKDRPDLIDVVFTALNAYPDVGPVLEARERVAGAARRGRAAGIVQRVSQGIPVLIIPPGGIKAGPGTTNVDVVCTNPDLASRARWVLRNLVQPTSEKP